MGVSDSNGSGVDEAREEALRFLSIEGGLRSRYGNASLSVF